MRRFTQHHYSTALQLQLQPVLCILCPCPTTLRRWHPPLAQTSDDAPPLAQESNCKSRYGHYLCPYVQRHDTSRVQRHCFCTTTDGEMKEPPVKKKKSRTKLLLNTKSGRRKKGGSVSDNKEEKARFPMTHDNEEISGISGNGSGGEEAATSASTSPLPEIEETFHAVLAHLDTKSTGVPTRKRRGITQTGREGTKRDPTEDAETTARDDVTSSSDAVYSNVEAFDAAGGVKIDKIASAAVVNAVPEVRKSRRTEAATAATAAVLDAASEDVRSGIAEGSALSSSPSGGSSPLSHTEKLNRLLQLEYGSETEASIPPNQRVISGDDESPMGDTPEELTNAIRERMDELKSEKITSIQSETHIPQRFGFIEEEETITELRSIIKNDERTRNRAAATRTAVDVINRNERAPHVDHTLPRMSEEDLKNFADDPRISLRDDSSNRPARFSSSSHELVNEGESDEDDEFAFALGQQPQHKEGSRYKDSDGSVTLLRAVQRAGFSSRRQGIDTVAAGNVKVNGLVVRNPFHRVVAQDDIHTAGHSQRLRFFTPRMWILHKPANVLVGRKDDRGRTLFTKYSEILGFDHIIPVGSMPYRAHGALLLTNDGDLARFLEHPATRIQSTYKLRVRPPIDPLLAHKFNTQGIMINGVRHTNFEFISYGFSKTRHAVRVKIKGESLPISQLMQHIGRTIVRGGRYSYGPYTILRMPPGAIKEVLIPPFFMKHVNPVWVPFIQRDMPFFRRLRIQRLKRLSRYRLLSRREVEELNAMTYDELRQQHSVASAELEEERERMRRAMHVQGPPMQYPLDDERLSSEEAADIVTSF